jgi:hypothetical protein
VGVLCCGVLGDDVFPTFALQSSSQIVQVSTYFAHLQEIRGQTSKKSRPGLSCVIHDKDKFQMQGIFGNGLKAHIIFEISTLGSLFWDNGINFPALTPAEVIRFYSVIIVQLWSFKLQPLTSQHIFLYLA